MNQERGASLFVSGVPDGCSAEDLKVIFGGPDSHPVEVTKMRPDKHYAFLQFGDTVHAEAWVRDGPQMVPTLDGSGIMKVEVRRRQPQRKS